MGPCFSKSSPKPLPPIRTLRARSRKKYYVTSNTITYGSFQNTMVDEYDKLIRSRTVKRPPSHSTKAIAYHILPPAPAPILPMMGRHSIEDAVIEKPPPKYRKVKSLDMPHEKMKIQNPKS